MSAKEYPDQLNRQEIRSCVRRAIQDVTVTDMHTHLFAPEFGDLNLWGIDALLTYHYLVAEVFRVAPMPYEDFWSMSRAQQADHIWTELFVHRPPISEAAQGVVRVLVGLGLDPCARDLTGARAYFAARDPYEYAGMVLNMAGVDELVMTNDPFDAQEAAVWMKGAPISARYRAALRLDHLLLRWPEACIELRDRGYEVTESLAGRTLREVRRFLEDWAERMSPLYLAASLPSDFTYPANNVTTRLLSEAVLPFCEENDLPMGLMIGVRRQVNPHLQLAGDAVGKADVASVGNIAAAFPGVRFLVTLLSRENQHELCVYARKFANIMPFGCWWFLNNPSIVAEITRERLEMLGATFVAQHSDARVLDQLLYKWPVSRKVVGEALADTYEALADAGRPITKADIDADVRRLFRDNFRGWVGLAG